MNKKIIGCFIILSWIPLGNTEELLTIENPKSSLFSKNDTINLNEPKDKKLLFSNENIKPVKVTPDLFLKENNLLSQQIEIWAEPKGYKLLWKAQRDYLIFKDIYIHGKDNIEVLSHLGDLLASQNYNLNIKFYKRNNVLVVDEN